MGFHGLKFTRDSKSRSVFDVFRGFHCLSAFRRRIGASLDMNGAHRGSESDRPTGNPANLVRATGCFRIEETAVLEPSGSKALKCLKSPVSYLKTSPGLRFVSPGLPPLRLVRRC